ncbi:response regulator transcription factor [Grimontia sp. NTOU-MAR1]|uniref:response regulator transcription factor n=1 Tax=Grimontia sp. NTOU-MAR1 TaxID=3111011 RepID=UPI002DBBF28E|nr:response regulator transcription factor [Grimontia sp. NTOU-MAR1]WRV97257.1 response regulator transcription factor [Grimontia sp. NTOU-MAR1]
MSLHSAPSAGQILIVDRNRTYCEKLIHRFNEKGFAIRRCTSDSQASDIYRTTNLDLVIFAADLPEMEGFRLLKRYREEATTPILMLDDTYNHHDCMNCFLFGADDYITRQQPLDEIVWRAAAVLRRSAQLPAKESKTQLVVDELVLDRKYQTVFYDGDEVSVTPIQFKLLWTLVFQQHQVLPKDFLYRQVLARDFQKYDRSLDMHLSRVRKKLVGVGMAAERLQTAHGKGYCFT